MPREYDKLDRSDLDEVLKVNAKAIEISNQISDQYEELLDRNTHLSNKIDQLLESRVEIKEIHNELKIELKEIKKTSDKILLLLGTGVISLIAQIITLLWHR